MDLPRQSATWLTEVRWVVQYRGWLNGDLVLVQERVVRD